MRSGVLLKAFRGHFIEEKNSNIRTILFFAWKRIVPLNYTADSAANDSDKSVNDSDKRLTNLDQAFNIIVRWTKPVK